MKRPFVVRLLLAPFKLVLMILVAAPIAIILILAQEPDKANKLLDAFMDA